MADSAPRLYLAGGVTTASNAGSLEPYFSPRPDGGPAPPPLYGEMANSAPRLYLAGGVTTARTAGSLEPYTDIELKRMIDAGLLPGPKLDVTGPYLDGKGSFAV